MPFSLSIHPRRRHSHAASPRGSSVGLSSTAGRDTRDYPGTVLLNELKTPGRGHDVATAAAREFENCETRTFPIKFPENMKWNNGRSLYYSSVELMTLMPPAQERELSCRRYPN